MQQESRRKKHKFWKSGKNAFVVETKIPRMNYKFLKLIHNLSSIRLQFEGSSEI